MRTNVEIIFDDHSIEITDFNANERRARMIEQIAPNGEVINIFPSIAAAEKELRIYHISECVNGIRKSAGGYYWRERGE